MDVQEFILARISEDEAAARLEDILRDGNPRYYDRAIGGGATAFEQHFTPQIVLAQCAALRTLVTPDGPYSHTDCVPDLPPEQSEFGHWCEMCDGQKWPCATVRIIAGIWSAHPDYDPAWVA